MPTPDMNVKDWAQVAQAIATTIALLVGGVWFFAKRKHAARANITHIITHAELDHVRTWIRLKILVSNCGDVMISVTNVEITVHQVVPDVVDAEIFPIPSKACAANPIRWHELANCVKDWKARKKTVEPGETDEITADMVVKTGAKVVSICSHIKGRAHSLFDSPNIDDFYESSGPPELGWTTSTTYDLVKGEKR